jgi:hypothetical protein
MRAEKVLGLKPALVFAFVFVPMTFPARAPQPIRQSGAISVSPPQNSKSSAAADSPAPSDPATAKLSDFAWLEGRWRGDWGPRVAEQVWLAPRAGVMEGMFRLIEADKTLVVEFFTLVQKPDGISFYFRHFTPSLAPWEKSDSTVLNLTSIGEKKSVFENPVNGMPKSSSLMRIDANTYVLHSELVPEAGDPQAIEITYKRQPAVTPAVSGGSGARQKKP